VVEQKDDSNLPVSDFFCLDSQEKVLVFVAAMMKAQMKLEMIQREVNIRLRLQKITDTAHRSRDADNVNK